jgi:hypothetical protein
MVALLAWSGLDNLHHASAVTIRRLLLQYSTIAPPDYSKNVPIGHCYAQNQEGAGCEQLSEELEEGEQDTTPYCWTL